MCREGKEISIRQQEEEEGSISISPENGIANKEAKTKLQQFYWDRETVGEQGQKGFEQETKTKSEDVQSSMFQRNPSRNDKKWLNIIIISK